MAEQASPEAASVAAPPVAEAPPVVETPPVVEASLAEPLVRHYLLAVASCGTYLLFRAYLLSRRLDAAARASRARALTWAGALLFAPAACAYLYEAARLARLEVVAQGGRPSRRPLLAAPLLYAAIALALLASPAASLWAPLLLLLPLPFVLVQAEVNAFEARRLTMGAPPAAGPVRRLAPIVAAALLPVTGFAIWHLDRQNVTSLKTSRRLSAGAIVQNSKAQFSLRVPSRGWERVGPGSVGDGSEEFGLLTRRGEVWVVVYTQPVAGTSLDGVVATRRGMVQRERAVLQKIDEQRFFLDGAELVPASFARYRMLYPRALGSLLVFTTTVGDLFVEVVGYASDDAEADVTKLVRSLKQGVQRS